jgi:hypothetical protein
VLARQDTEGQQARQDAARARGPRNTQLIEPPAVPAARPPGGPVRRDTVKIQPPVAPATPAAAPPARPKLQLDDDLGREEAKTLELRLPLSPPAAPAAPPPRPVAPPPPVAKETARDVAPPVQPVKPPLSPLAALVRPGAPAAAKPVADRPATATSASSSTLRKADSKWGRPQEGPASPPRTAPKTPPPPRPVLRDEDDDQDTGTRQAPPIEAAPPPRGAAPAQAAVASPPVSAPPPETPPQSSLASMFSWVTQKPAWSPSPEALDPPHTERAEPPAMSMPEPTPIAPAAAPAPIAPAPVAPAAAAPAPVPAAPPAEEPVALSSEETLVLIHYDDAAGVGPVADATGMSEWRVQKIVDRLKERGVLEPPPALEEAEPDRMDTVLEMQAPTSSSFEELFPSTQPSRDAASPASERGAKPSHVGERTLLELEIEYPEARERARTDEIAGPHDPEETVVDPSLDADLPVLVEDDLPVPVDEPKFPPVAANTSPVAGIALAGPLSSAHSPVSQAAATQPSRGSEPPPASEDHALEKDEATEEAEAEEAAARAEEAEGAPGRMSLKEEEEKTKSWHSLFENVLALLNSDERTRLASVTADKDKLFAFAYDKEPPVVRALWSNPNINNDHARFAAFHHRTTAGLELIGLRTEFLRDPQVQRRLIRNPMISETLLRKMLLSKRLIDIYKITLDRETGDRTRQSARGLLRNKFATTDPEDRLELIWKTEGRALIALSGLSIDSKTAALICARPIVSVMLVQSFSKFAATPPSVISHFLKQPMVKRQINLKHALLKHPNCPSDAKRAF